jgi:hypothetical protein
MSSYESGSDDPLSRDIGGMSHDDAQTAVQQPYGQQRFQQPYGQHQQHSGLGGQPLTHQSYGYSGQQSGGPMYGQSYGQPFGQSYGYGGGPSYGQTQWARPRRQFPIETKPFFLTSEFVGAVLAIAGIAITAASSEAFGAWRAWILITAVLVGYMVSRGIAKSGTRSHSSDPRESLDLNWGRGDSND